MKIPRIVIAGTNSGCGKTTITAGIMAALVKRGLVVQPFKVGPDYIDPMFHTYITGKNSRNLDSWMLDPKIVKYLFEKNAACCDIAVIEGVMGMYDGFGARSKIGSTAHVSTVIKAPVLLVLNAEGMSLSAAAMVEGFKNFDSDVEISGVILNNVKGEATYSLLKEVIEWNTGIQVVGYLPRSQEYTLKSRHLGLVASDEVDDLRSKVDTLAEQVEKTVDLDAVIRIAQQAQWVAAESGAVMERYVNLCDGKHPRIAVAMDKAFNFYYWDNLNLLEQMGAQLEFFSPLKDKYLPHGVQGLYIGGGYPEVWAKELQENIEMRKCMKEQIRKGLPVYAECGGFMYLTEYIKNKEGHSHEMVGVIPGYCEMTTSLKRFGYVEIECTNENVMCKSGKRIRAHEFHYSCAVVGSEAEMCYKVEKKREGKEPVQWECGYKVHNVLAGYPHLHFWANPDFAAEFVRNCSKYID